MTIRIGLILEPLDVLFFRDGRPFEAGIRVGGQTDPAADLGRRAAHCFVRPRRLRF